MTDNIDILQVRFSGNEISPGKVKPHEIAEIITAIEKSLLSVIKEKHPEIDTDQLLFSLEEVSNQSLGFGFTPRLVANIITSCYSFISTSVSTGDFSKLNNDAITNLKVLTRFAKKYNCVGDFNLNGETISTITPTTEIVVNKKPLIKGDVKLFGKVLDAGGKNPNVHILINDEKELIFPTSETNAKELAYKLYEKVTLIGTAKWDPDTYEIKEFKLIEIDKYSTGKTKKAIDDLKNLSSGFWDNFGTNDEINNQLFREK